MIKSISQFIQNMPKAEIHIHLEGAIQPATLLKLAERHHKLDTLPGTDVAALQQWFTFTDFPHFIQIYDTIQNLLRTSEDFELITYECGADMAAQNILYREVTFTPYTHIYFQNKGITITDILAGLDAGRQRAKHDFGVEIRWVFDIPRGLAFDDNKRYIPKTAERTLEFALAGQDQGVIGFGLGGNEVDRPPEPFAHAFTAAKEAGMLSVPHAGEIVGAESVWGAINALDADRIGHGVRAIEDPTLVDLLVERQIPLEINPTSNECLHVYPNFNDHPFRKLDEMGVLVTVNSDDPPLFNTTLCREYERLATEFGYDEANLTRIARNAFLVAGVEPDVKTQLLAEFDAWEKEGQGARGKEQE